MAHKIREQEALVRAAEAQGFRVRVVSKGWLVFPKDGTSPLPLHRTPSDYRGNKNAIAALRRMGVRI